MAEVLIKRENVTEREDDMKSHREKVPSYRPSRETCSRFSLTALRGPGQLTLGSQTPNLQN